VHLFLKKKPMLVHQSHKALIYFIFSKLINHPILAEQHPTRQHQSGAHHLLIKGKEETRQRHALITFAVQRGNARRLLRRSAGDANKWRKPSVHLARPHQPAAKISCPRIVRVVLSTSATRLRLLSNKAQPYIHLI
jgi:hypothetical protein